MNIKLSVVIPVGSGRLNNLHLVLTSLEAQTFKDFEVIVVNDGNKDEDYWSICELHKKLDLKYVYAPKHEPSHGTIQPRNRGARNALNPFIVFADTDVLLRSDALSWYAKDFGDNPNRVVCGSYHWLRPMRITTQDVLHRFDDIVDERLQWMTIPQPQTHNIARDMRMSLFNERPPEFVYQAITPEERIQRYPTFLACFSGNIAFPAKVFWDVSGYWDELVAGLHEDGCMGLQLMMAGKGVSFDKRIIGGHIYHGRDIQGFVHKYWLTEIPLINQRFKLEKFADSAGPRDTLPPLEVMSQEALKAWGVSEWTIKSKDTADKESKFRGI